MTENIRDFWCAWLYAHASAMTGKCNPENQEIVFARNMFTRFNSWNHKELCFVLEYFLDTDADWFRSKLKNCKDEQDIVSLILHHFPIPQLSPNKRRRHTKMIDSYLAQRDGNHAPPRAGRKHTVKRKSRRMAL